MNRVIMNIGCDRCPQNDKTLIDETVLRLNRPEDLGPQLAACVQPIFDETRTCKHCGEEWERAGEFRLTVIGSTRKPYVARAILTCLWEPATARNISLVETLCQSDEEEQE